MDGTIRIKSLVWFCTGAVTMLMATMVVMQAWQVDAAPGDTDATLVPITPCRLVDTREPGQAPLNDGEIRTVEAHGTNGPIVGSQCTIPTDAVALSMNVTALNASTGTFWTVWPTGAPQPEASSLNPAPGQPPTPNAVTTSLSSDGEFDVFNNNGTVGMLIDVNGYYTNTSLQELTNRLTAVEDAQAVGVDPAVLARIAANETNIATNTADIDGLDAREPFAVTTFLTASVFPTETPTAYVSVDVTAPVDGHVTLNSTAYVSHPTDGGDILCAIVEDDNIPPNNISFTTPSIQRWETGGFGDQGSLSGTRTFDISANTTITYSLACEEFVDGGQILSRNLTAIFTPTP